MSFIKYYLYLPLLVLISAPVMGQPLCLTDLSFLELPEEQVPFTGEDRNLVAIADIDGDDDLDIYIQGVFYENDGSGNFIDLGGLTILNYEGVITPVDIDGDNDIDFMITSGTNVSAYFLINDGTGNFSYELETGIISLLNSSHAFADIDGDNDLDVLVTGLDYPSDEKIIKLYRNNGLGEFTEIADTPLEAVHIGDIAFADIDGDNDMDVLIAGQPNFYLHTTKMYTNDGYGNFSYVEGTPFEAVNNCDLEFADVDGDNDQDLLLTGYTATLFGTGVSYLYENDGSGNFTYVSGTPFVPTFNSKVVFVDIDGDTDMDVLLDGYGISAPKLYTNDGTGEFTENEDTPFLNSNNTHIAVGDIDGDNDQDVLFVGSNCRMYENTGTILPTGVDIQTSCEAYNWIDGNTYYINNNTASHLIPNGAANGCDSVALLNLSIEYDITNDIYEVCEPIVWIDGNTYTESNYTASYTYTNSAGCDSIVKLNLTIGNSSSTATFNTCNTSFAWIDGNTYTESNNTATYITTNSVGCDSTIYLNLNMNSNTGIDIQTSCGPYNWIDGNIYTESNNTASYTLTNSAGCDSVVTLNLSIEPLDSSVGVSGNILTANLSEATYQWLDCNNGNEAIAGATSQSFTPLLNGDYAVQITKDDCSEISNCTNISSIGLAENNISKYISFYPNPTNGIVHIQLEKLTDVSITVMNVMGQVLYHWEEIQSSSFTFDLDQEPAYYLVAVHSAEGNWVYKLLKK